MALSPAEVERIIAEGMHLTVKQRELCDRLERRIDRALPRIYRRGKVIRPMKTTPPKKVARELARRYSLKCWRVDIEPATSGWMITLTSRRNKSR